MKEKGFFFFFLFEFFYKIWFGFEKYLYGRLVFWVWLYVGLFVFLVVLFGRLFVWFFGFIAVLGLFGGTVVVFFFFFFFLVLVFFVLFVFLVLCVFFVFCFFFFFFFFLLWFRFRFDWNNLLLMNGVCRREPLPEKTCPWGGDFLLRRGGLQENGRGGDIHSLG